MLNLDYPEVRPGPPVPSTIIQPRVFSLPPGTERYTVQGSGAILVPVHAGDRISITNDEGAQLCEVVAATGKGVIDAKAMLGLNPDNDASGIKALLTSDEQSLRGLRMGLDARKIDLAKAGAVAFFGEKSIRYQINYGGDEVWRQSFLHDGSGFG